MLRISAEDIENGDTIVVNQMGSSNTIFRSSNELIYIDPNAEEGDTEETTETETEDTSANTLAPADETPVDTNDINATNEANEDNIVKPFYIFIEKP